MAKNNEILWYKLNRKIVNSNIICYTKFVTDTELNYSELVYLHAEKYVSDGSFLQNKEELPNGKKVYIVKLGDLASEAAFAYLYFNGYVDLQIENRKTLGIFSKQVVVPSKKSDGAGLTSLEKTFFDLSDGKTDVSNILYRAIGDECPVPWGVITGIIKESLVSKEYLTRETITKKILVTFTTYKYHLNPSINDDLKDPVEAMDKKLKEFSKNGFYKILVKEIDAGISLQKETPDNDSD